ncbi:MAG TPA: arylsulfatase [Puia sp.]|jgi:arylsulfatase A-like enzyme
MFKRNHVHRIVSIAICCFEMLHSHAQTHKPNVIIIYTDDLGYGDVSCYGAKKISTPNVDELAKNGLLFTNAHCTASTCTPSRFSLITGKYAWRQKGTGIADGDAPLIISPETETLPAMLKKAGYRTAVVGKWHLGLGGKGGPDWNSDLKPGPLEIGFDYSFIIPATADRVPCVFVKDHRVVGWDSNDLIRVNYHNKIGSDPTGYEHPEMLKVKANPYHSKTIVDSISRIGFMSGGIKARWVDEDIAKTLKDQAINFIDQNSDEPFFLYFATHDIHVPHAPNSLFMGKSSMGIRGDAILQMDWTVGEILAHLKEKNILENTLIIFSSDNGPVLQDGYEDDAVAASIGHDPAGPYRGGKYSPYEGGTRVPFIVYWPARVRHGVTSALFSQIDLFASLAKLSGQQVTKGEAPDSFNMLPTLLGDSKIGRNYVVEQAMNDKLSLIYKKWKYVEEGQQLYDLSKDQGEQHNVSKAQAKILLEMTKKIEVIKQQKNQGHPVKL